MSCRRNDRARFVGCHVGPVRIRGCDRGCCSYSDSETESNERWNYTQQRPGIQFDPSTRSSHHPGIAPSRNHPCKTSHRPKFVCVACRRAFKPAFIEGNLYDIWASSWHMGWWWSPSRSKIPEKSNPALWWKPMSTLRCPGCGEAGVPVGGTFRAPPQKDARGWANVSKLLERGEMFSYCLTQQEEAALIEDAQIENTRLKNSAGWEETKARRIAELKNLPEV
ncbi:hypothetical protein DFH09DRAFT_1423295, partial [Mycena vulgaris]